MSMISRQKLIEELDFEIGHSLSDARRSMLIDIIEIIESQPPADSGPDTNVGTNQWIPCSEITVEQVVEAMKVIKSYCSQYKNCAGCRFEDWCWYDREHLTPDDWLMPQERTEE